jgi:hypothetical protein
MTNPKRGLEGLLQVERVVLSPITALDGPRGILLDFQPLKALAPMPPARIALTVEQAKDLVRNLTKLIHQAENNPSKPEEGSTH